MQILDILGMYFDAVVAEVEKYLFFQIGSGYTVYQLQNQSTFNILRKSLTWQSSHF